MSTYSITTSLCLSELVSESLLSPPLCALCHSVNNRPGTEWHRAVVLLLKPDQRSKYFHTKAAQHSTATERSCHSCEIGRTTALRALIVVLSPESRTSGDFLLCRTNFVIIGCTSIGYAETSKSSTGSSSLWRVCTQCASLEPVFHWRCWKPKKRFVFCTGRLALAGDSKTGQYLAVLAPPDPYSSEPVLSA